MNIAVYSGSFNPLHIGHLAVLRTLCEDGKFDMVYLLVSPKNPLKDIDPSSAEERFNAAKEALSRHPEIRAKADNIELLMPPPQYSVRTLEALKKREPENNFTLAIGADNLGCIRKWRDYSKILTDFGVIVYPRDGFNIEKLKKELLNEPGGENYKIATLQAPEVNISSTIIREAIKEGNPEKIKKYLM